MMNRFWKLLLLIVFIILTDQFAKAAIQTHLSVGDSEAVWDGIFYISHLCNYGALMGFLSEAPKYLRTFVFLYMPILAALLLIAMLVMSLKQRFYLSLIYSLVLAGVVSNTLDRATLGYVVDWISIKFGGFTFPTFNLADASIAIGIGIILVDLLIDLFLKAPPKDA
ncbi:MAG: signal peptidase II [Bacteriovoracaceae bacterium]|nr:signal peptidase II [Bacteriovoracaceae bacterium]